VIESVSTFGGPDEEKSKHGVFQQRALVLLEEGAVEGLFEGEMLEKMIGSMGKDGARTKSIEC
jgi:hypothetical protein